MPSLLFGQADEFAPETHFVRAPPPTPRHRPLFSSTVLSPSFPRSRFRGSEDADWAVGSKSNSKKAAEEEKRRLAQARKAEASAQLASEESELAKYKPKPKKAEKRAAQVEKFTESLKKDVPEFSASNIDDAIDLLTLDNHSSTGFGGAGGGPGAAAGDKLDRHPERRAKAAYNTWLERELPDAKAENPGLRLSQLKEMLWKRWQKSPENPLNAENAIAYNATKNEEREKIQAKKREVEQRLRVK
ncbi:MAG: hypothetical protein BJ554DRAFT_5243 [Olpidium bornovanus]|uniref:HMG box domain-containing protein n=1 Tax=Olpidium bornovanus TaxID=278681 RepID=A0A8H7ZZX5_9FUNG|nr:MAG: hypothetical protein BJ554DRAFT_5243 [Olpidium bornovanus]